VLAIVRESSRTRHLWDGVAIVLAIVSLVATPLRASFGTGSDLGTLNWLHAVELFFVADIDCIGPWQR
jgi:hypothetical protein